MKRVVILLADGFEEAEALVPADLLIRAGADVRLTALERNPHVTGSHGFRILPDGYADDVRMDDPDLCCLFLPGGKGGTERLAGSERVAGMLRSAVNRGLLIAAICAAPSVLGKLGLLDGRRYTCYPGFERFIQLGTRVDESVVRDGPFLTGEGMGASLEFGFALVRELFGETAEAELREKTRNRA